MSREGVGSAVATCNAIKPGEALHKVRSKHWMVMYKLEMRPTGGHDATQLKASTPAHEEAICCYGRTSTYSPNLRLPTTRTATNYLLQ